jgi:uncharacterized protein
VNLGRVFVDTGAWFALVAIDDANHRAARDAFPVVVSGCRALVTSNLVVGETYTLLRVVKGYRQAKAFLERLRASAKLDRVFVTESLEGVAYGILDRYSEHPFSFVDATSFAVMRQGQIRHAFAFDRHFRIAGFLRIPADVPLEQ